MENPQAKNYSVKLLKEDGSTFEAQIAPPTLQRRDLVRALKVENSRCAVKIDSRYTEIETLSDEDKFIQQSIWSNEAEKMNDEFIIKYFVILVNQSQLEDENVKYFKEESDEILKFWENQNLDELKKAVEFFFGKLQQTTPK